MKNISFLQIQSKNPLTNMYMGSILLSIAIFDVFISSFFSINITSFLPQNLSTFLPLIIGFVGLGILRMDYTGVRLLDNVNKNINTNNFNALLTLLIIFALFKATPPALSWMILDANISGDTKESCTGSGACWTYIKVWFRRFMYGMYPNDLHWRINSAFILVIVLGFVGYFFKDNLKKYLALYYVVIYPIIAFLIIYYLISGGSFGLVWVETGAWGGLSLTFIVSFFCLIFCFPLGMILALGRRSNLPAVRYISVGYIEF